MKSRIRKKWSTVTEVHYVVKDEELSFDNIVAYTIGYPRFIPHSLYKQQKNHFLAKDHHRSNLIRDFLSLEFPYNILNLKHFWNKDFKAIKEIKLVSNKQLKVYYAT